MSDTEREDCDCNSSRCRICYPSDEEDDEYSDNSDNSDEEEDDNSDKAEDDNSSEKEDQNQHYHYHYYDQRQQFHYHFHPAPPQLPPALPMAPYDPPAVLPPDAPAVQAEAPHGPPPPYQADPVKDDEDGLAAGYPITDEKDSFHPWEWREPKREKTVLSHKPGKSRTKSDKSHKSRTQ